MKCTDCKHYENCKEHDGVFYGDGVICKFAVAKESPYQYWERIEKERKEKEEKTND